MRARVSRARVNRDDPHDPYKIFLANEAGRLITGLTDEDVLVEYDDDLRIKPTALAPAVASALEPPALKEVTDDQPESTGIFEFEQNRYRVSYRLIKDTWGWRLGIVGPEDYYRKSLRDRQRAMLLLMSAAFALLFLGGPSPYA